MNPRYWELKTPQDLLAVFVELCGETCDSFRGSLACWPADDKAQKPALWSAEFWDWAGHSIKVELGVHTHLMLTANGYLEPLTDAEFVKLQGVLMGMFKQEAKQ